jgi:hypothetical protein
VTALVTAGAGFLLAVLWFDLMFDVQVLRHRGGEVPEEVLASVAAYYRRVTTEAAPMNRLVAAVMIVTLGAIVVQIASDEAPRGAAWASLLLAGLPIGIAAARTFPAAVRLGARTDAVEVQSRLARSICRDHLLCLAGIAALIAVQLAFAA